MRHVETHSDVLASLEDLRRGTLAADQRRRVEAHLEGCDACRRLAGRMDFDAPAPDLAPGVMEALAAEGAWQAEAALAGAGASGGLCGRRHPAWLWAALALAALLLAASAFWRPERGWLRVDQGYILDERPAAWAPHWGGRR